MDNRRLFIAVLLSLAVLLVWQYFFPAKPPQPPAHDVQADLEEVAGTEPDLPATGGPTGVPSPERAEAPAVPAGPPIEGQREERVFLESPWARAIFSSRGAQLISYQLKADKTVEGKPLELVKSRQEGPYPFGLLDRQGRSDPLNQAFFAARTSGSSGVTFLYRGPAGEAEKRFTFDDDGLLGVDMQVRGRQGWRVLLGPGARDLTPAEIDSRYLLRSAIAEVGGEIQRVDAQKAEVRQVFRAPGLQWIGVQDNYYLAAAIPRQGLERAVLDPVLVEPGSEGGRFLPLPPEDQITKEQKKLKRELRVLLVPAADRLTLKVFLGAKAFDRLAKLPYHLERSIDLGMFAFLAKPLLAGLHWIHAHVVANYGWAIILMTVLIKILLLPLTHKTYVSMQKMQKLNPRMQAIRDKYRSKMRDKQGRPNAEAQQKMNQEIMALYKEEGVNPAGGCLPMLLQLPILFAFFKLLTATVELRNAPWILWIKDLSEFDPHYVLPLVMTFTQFIQTRMTPAAGDPMQRRMFQLMPLFMLFFFVWSPSGLVLYWLTNNVLTIVQQGVYNHLKQRRAEG